MEWRILKALTLLPTWKFSSHQHFFDRIFVPQTCFGEYIPVAIANTCMAWMDGFLFQIMSMIYNHFFSVRMMPLEGFPTHEYVFPILHTHVSNMLEHVGPPYFISPCSNLSCRWMANSSWKDRSPFPATRAVGLMEGKTHDVSLRLESIFQQANTRWLELHLLQLLWTTSINHSKPKKTQSKLLKFSKQLSLFTSYYASFFSKHLK